MSTLTYLRSFFMDKDVASVTPTSKFCIRRVCEPIDFGKDQRILEYGAGTGVFARYLLKRMSPASSLVMFETNEILFEKLKEIKDSRIQLYNRSVEYAEELIGSDTGYMGKVDYIISGIPFSFLDERTKFSILEQSRALLREGGGFLAYQTSGHLKDLLREVFGSVETEWEWRNIPPMTVYRAFK